MTDDDIQIFLTLKYSSMDECLHAFKQAIGYPRYEGLPYKIPNEVIMAGIKAWVEAGAPRKMDIPEDKTEFFLKLKFGNLKNAYDYWIACGKQPNYLSDNELKIVMDYVPKSK